MSKSVHSVKLIPYDSVDLDRLSYSSGDIVYDVTNGTLRLMDGVTQGGSKIASQSYVTNSLAAYATTSALTTAINNEITARNLAISTALTSYATTASLSSYATTASLSSYATTASLSSYATTASLSTATVNLAGSARKLTTARTINSVAFDGSANISVSTLVNGANTVTLSSGGGLTFPNLSSFTGTDLYSAPNTYIELSSNDGNNVVGAQNDSVFVQTAFYTNNYTWTFGLNGTLTAPGNIKTTTGTITAKNVIIGGVNIKTFAIAMGAALA